MIKIIHFLYCFLSVTFVAAGDNPDQFLTALERGKGQTKTAKKSKSSKGISDQVGKVVSTNDQAMSWLTNLSNQPSYQEQEKKKEEEAQKAEQAEQLQNLDVLQNYYGNPDYQSAMQILQNSTLQQEYEQAMNSMELFFFEYTQQVLGHYHSSQKKKVSQNTKNISSFLGSLSDKRTTSLNVSPASKHITSDASDASSFQSSEAMPVAKSSSGSSQSSATSFLDSLEG